jgi:hypothetical protein
MGLRILCSVRQAAVDARIDQLIPTRALASEELGETQGFEMAMELRVAGSEECAAGPAIAVLVIDKDGDTAPG